MLLRKKQDVLCIERLLQKKTAVKITNRKQNSHLADKQFK